MMPFAATWIGLEIILLSEVSQKGKDQYHMISLICDTNELIYEIETESQTQRIDLQFPRGKGWGRDGLGVWNQQIQTIIYRMDKQQGPTVVQKTVSNIL